MDVTLDHRSSQTLVYTQINSIIDCIYLFTCSLGSACLLSLIPVFHLSKVSLILYSYFCISFLFDFVNSCQYDVANEKYNIIIDKIK